MSMFGTLAKVGMGIMVAKGVGKMMQNRSGGSGGGGALGGLGDMLGGAGGGLGGMLGGAGGGLGGMLGGMLGGGQQQQAPQSARDMGGMLGGRGNANAGGGLGGLLDSLQGGGVQQQQAAGAPPAPQSGGFGDMLNSAFSQFGEPETAPTPEQEDQAKLMLRAMIAAAKSDGQIDENEKQKLMGELGEVDQEEAEFVKSELAAPLDLEGLIRDVPQGMEQQVYAMSVMAIDLDSQQEAQYLDRLAKGLGIDQQTSNAIHAQMGAPALYA